MIKHLKYLVLILPVFAMTASYAQQGVLNGKVIDAINNEPLPFVNVVVLGTNIGTTSDMDGNFTITGLEPGFKRVKASYVGYNEKISEEVRVTNANPGYIEIQLEQANETLEEVQVKASPFMRSGEAPVALKSIGISEIEKAPGANRDISLVIQSYAGVSSSASFRNDIIVRGGGPSESTFYLDGVEIPNINHFATQGSSGGPVGILNADFIREVNFYSGAFPANRGGALSAVFDFRQVDGSKEKLNFSGALGASEVAATLDGPIGDKTTFIASARRSYLQFLFDAIGLPFLPTFNDFQFKTRTRINEKNEIILLGVGAIDQFALNTGIENPDDQQAYILNTIPVNEQWSYTTGAVYKHYSENGYQTLALSRNHLNNTSYKYLNNNEEPENLIYDYASDEIETKIRGESTMRMNGYKLTYGLGAELAEYSNSTYQRRFYGNDVFEVNYETALDLWQWDVFAQLSKSYFNDKLSLSMGIRTDANAYAASMSNPLDQLSPRFSASYMLTDKWSVNMNLGRYFQLPPYTSLGYKDNGEFVNKSNDLKYIQSDHYIAGFKYLLNENTQIRIEGFYKDYADYPFSVNDSLALANKGANFGVIGNEEVVPTGEGRAYGVEIEGRIKDLNGLSLNSSLTLVRSEFEDFNGELIPSSWDNRYIFLTTASKRFGKNWTVGVKFRFLGGLPYTPYDMEKSAQVDAWDTRGGPFQDNSRINEKRFKPFQQLDMRVDREFFFNKWSLNVYLDVQNVYNFQAEQKDIILQERNKNGEPVINNGEYELRRVENPTGTVLPTLGIVVEF